MDEIERVILRFFEAQPEDFAWVIGKEFLDRDETIRRFKKDKRFRKFVKVEIERTAVETKYKRVVKLGKQELVEAVKEFLGLKE